MMAGLSIGMRIYVNHQFVSTDTYAPVDLMFNAGRRLSGVTDEATIDPNVITCHATRCEALLETATHLATIQRSHLRQRNAGLIDIVDDHAGDALVDHFRDRSSA